MDNRPHVLPPMKNHEEIVRLLKKYPLPLQEGGNAPMTFGYGTAGFRYDASLLDSIMVRVGILAAVRSTQLKQQVGVMVTASHNDESYNGVKISDPDGGMMAPDGEVLAVQLANASLDELSVFLKTHSISDTAVVHVGRDTRSHSPHLSQLTVKAAQAMGATVVSHGICTTPMLHHAVLHANPQHLPLLIPPRPNVEGYYSLLAHSYHNLLLTADHNMLQQVPNKEPLVVDCACGVGYEPVVRLNKELQQLSPYCRTLVACNAPGQGPLNEKCGSEHVQKEISPPKWYTEENNSNTAPRYAASLDGDADRIVFFCQSPQFALLDGDKIAVLICDFLQTQVDMLQSALQKKGSTLLPLKLGVVQTAYANGASTDYLRNVMEHVLIAKTGVKHVHTAAHDNFDVAVYFEANGHGTVLFGSAFYQAMTQAHQVVPGNVALRRLCLLPSLVNQAVGDALSDLLLVDAILQLKQWDLQTWNGLYTDLPSRQCKVKVQDRSIIQTNENETRATRPAELQAALDKAVIDIPGRCFVRPSGTENVVRVYAEAKTSQDADNLASKAAQLVHDLCDGVGTVPSFPTSNL